MSDPVGSIKPNPLAFAYDAENLYERTVANLMGGARYEIIDGLALDFQAGTDIFFGTGQYFSGNYVSNYHPNASISNSRSITIQTTTQLSYDKTLSEIHRISAVIAVETQKYTNKSSNSSASDLKFAELKYYNLGQAGSFSAGSGFSKSTLLSYLGRINYSLLDRYLFSVSVRRDGSSKFAEGKKFSTFPSAAVAWNLRNESFMQDIDLFSKLKIRASWGLTGSQAIGSYATQSLYNGVIASFTPNGRTSGIQIGNPGNIDLTWETTEQTNLGLEVGFFNGRLNVEVDYFAKHTRDLLLNKSVPMYIGGGNIVSNVGETKNTGWELLINAVPVSTGNIKWETQFNISKVKNQVTSLGKEKRVFSEPNISGIQGQPEFIYAVGESLGSFWGLKYLGTWKKGQETEAARYNKVPGDARYEDLDNDGSITGEDYQIIGCGVPKISLGWNNTVQVKNFSFNMFFEGMLDFDKLNHTMAQNFVGIDTRYPTLAAIKERYIPGVNESAFYPAFSTTNVWETHSTMFLENSSYIRLKNISVGYDFKIKNYVKMKVSLNALNLLTITKYKGIDPESSNVGGGGSDIVQSVDYGAYPNSKAYTIGIDITF
jgi:TonB-linked SusC/RagA family outer membrane protein